MPTTTWSPARLDHLEQIGDIKPLFGLEPDPCDTARLHGFELSLRSALRARAWGDELDGLTCSRLSWWLTLCQYHFPADCSFACIDQEDGFGFACYHEISAELQVDKPWRQDYPVFHPDSYYVDNGSIHFTEVDDDPFEEVVLAPHKYARLKHLGWRDCYKSKNRHAKRNRRQRQFSRDLRQNQRFQPNWPTVEPRNELSITAVTDDIDFDFDFEYLYEDKSVVEAALYAWWCDMLPEPV